MPAASSAARSLSSTLDLRYLSASPERRRRPATIEQLAATPLVFYDAESADEDPIRRQLAERAQALGSTSNIRLDADVSATQRDASTPDEAGEPAAAGDCCNPHG